jgi:hypothetical protein
LAPAVDQILNFLDYIGMLHRQGVLTLEDASSLCGRRAIVYRVAADDYVIKMRRIFPRGWNDLDELAKAMGHRFGTQLSPIESLLLAREALVDQFTATAVPVTAPIRPMEEVSKNPGDSAGVT